MVDPRPPAAPASGGGGNEAVATIIPYRNPLALAAYYVGVFSLIPCVGLLLGPAAFFLGLSGLRAAKRHPEMKGKGHAIAGMVLGGLVLVAHIAIIGILIAKN